MSILRISGCRWKPRGGAGAQREETPLQEDILSKGYDPTNPQVWHYGELAISLPMTGDYVLVLHFPFTNEKDESTKEWRRPGSWEGAAWVPETWARDNLHAMSAAAFTGGPTLQQVLTNIELILHLLDIGEVFAYEDFAPGLCERALGKKAKFRAKLLDWHPLMPAEFCELFRTFCHLHGPNTRRIWKHSDHQLANCAFAAVVASHIAHPKISFLHATTHEQYYDTLRQLRRHASMPSCPVFDPIHFLLGRADRPLPSHVPRSS